MTADTIHETFAYAFRNDLEVAIHKSNDDVVFGLVIEARASEALISGRGSVAFRPLLQYEFIASVRVLDARPTQEAVRRLHLERRKARAFVPAPRKGAP